MLTMRSCLEPPSGSGPIETPTSKPKPVVARPIRRCSLDAHLSHVATKLLAVSASINAGLEKSMVEIMVSVPRMVTEVQRVETGIKHLQAELANLLKQVRDARARRAVVGPGRQSRRTPRVCLAREARRPRWIVGRLACRRCPRRHQGSLPIWGTSAGARGTVATCPRSFSYGLSRWGVWIDSKQGHEGS